MSKPEVRLKRVIWQLNLNQDRLTELDKTIKGFDPANDDEFTLEQHNHGLNKLETERKLHMNELFEVLPEALFDEWAEKDRVFIDMHTECSIQVRRLLSGYKKDEKPGGGEKGEPKTNIKLPDIPLPTFGGKYDDWVYFREKFMALITNNKTLQDVHKLHYLRASLKDEAATLQSPNDSFQSLWSTLLKRYENKRIIVEKHISELLHMRKMTYESSSELRTLVDVVIKNLRVLKTMELDLTPLAEQFVISVVSSLIDSETRKAYETQLKSNELPNWTDTLSFLQQRCHTLESIENSKGATTKTKSPATPSTSTNKTATKPFRTSAYVTNADRKPNLCPVCEKAHLIHQCPEFLNLTAESRLALAKKLHLCFNCLNPNHSLTECRSGCCRHCHQKHNSLLHLGKIETKQPLNNDTPSSSTAHCSTEKSAPATDSLVVIGSHVLLSTVVLLVLDQCGTPIHCRALLDSGSQSNFVSQHFAQMIKAKQCPINASVAGINQTNTSIKSKVSLTIKSRINHFTTSLDFLVISKITGNVPSAKINIRSWQIPKDVVLADPQFDIPQQIDMLIGAELFFDVWTNQQIKMQKDLPSLRETVFGWVVAGKTNQSDTKSFVTTTFCACVTNNQLQDQLKRFWEIENCEPKKRLTIEEQQAEKHFSDTIKRQPDGRYIVTLPTKPNLNQLGDSKQMAVKRFYCLERKLARHPAFKQDYTAFIDEYLNLHHMKLSEPASHQHTGVINYFIPHHAVVKPESSSTKLRVVFDASASTSAGLSLNNVLNVGPTIQPELFEIVLRFRKYKYVCTADISKMYRQILVNEEQQKLQQILWRSNPAEPLKEYQLKTVTYGTACAPFLATRVLQQLADDEADNFPVAAQATRTDFYVDDFLSGADNIPDALKLQSQLIQLLLRGGFHLHKWCANVPELLQQIPEDKREKKVQLAENEAIKTLGLTWQPTQDTFVVSIDRILLSLSRITKRSILSDVARLYDPLGIVGPIILTAKIMLQKLWQKQLDWDDPLEPSDAADWIEFRDQLLEVQHIEIQRCVIPFENCKSVQLLGFCDGSTSAYGACVYVHCVSQENQRATTLLCSKSRVAPLKVITVPRLELCGAVLLSQLVVKVKQAMNIDFDKITLFSDSTIVLSWIRSQSTKMKTFVSHRIAEIQDLTSPDSWRHVPTDENPADIISRGLMPSQLGHSDLWWTGPVFLTQPENYWPKNPVIVKENELPEMKTVTSLVTHHVEDAIIAVTTKFSSLYKIQRTVAYVLRFISNIRKHKEDRLCQHITAVEMLSSLKVIIRTIQQKEFASELKSIKKGESICNKSPLKPLNVFIDADDILRVGGRIRNSSQAFDTKHQMILPKNNQFVQTLARHLHQQHGHVGQQALLAIIRQAYWPLRAKDLVKFVTRRCITCFKCQPKSVQQFMGDLPAVRVALHGAFIHVGVDYAGPLLLKLNRRTAIKSYVAIFICMATKAVHIELVSDSSTKAFLAALDRFIARRGHCQTLYSDNGSNFLGAKNELSTLYRMVADPSHQHEVASRCAQQHIEFRFIPPRAPHFGGLWEAAVKSMKFHLTRIVGQTQLTFEEMATILTKIESILNSRPLVVASNDPEDPAALTPGHFLVGRPLIAVIEPNYTSIASNRLNRWQLLQQMSQHFWQRWSNEYLTTLQQRSKPAIRANVQIGMIVLLKEDNLPPQQWLLGRIIELHPGADGIVRVVSVKTKTSIFKRPVVKVCILPLDDEKVDNQCYTNEK
jgi:hypothetical protein